jgi:hypothetical protein
MRLGIVVARFDAKTPIIWAQSPRRWLTQNIALVVVRGGALVPEAVDRLARVARFTPFGIEAMLTDMPASDVVSRFVRSRVDTLGTILLLDENGKEVAHD